MMAQAVCRGEVCILGSSSTGRRLRDKDKCGMASTGVPQTIQPLFSEHNVVTPSPWWNSEYPSQVAMATKRERSMVMELIKGEERKATWDSRCYLLQVSLSWKSLYKLVYISKGRVSIMQLPWRRHPWCCGTYAVMQLFGGPPDSCKYPFVCAL